MARDMTKAQFLAALDRNGIGRPEFMGYCDMRRKSGGMSMVSYLNAPTSRWRDRLAYLIERKRESERKEVAVNV